MASTAILLAATAQYVQADETSSLFTNPKPREEVAEQTKEMIQDSSQEQGSQISTTPDKTVMETETPNVPTELSLAQGAQPSTLEGMPEEKVVSEKDVEDSSKPTSPSLTKGQSTFYTAGDASRTKRSASQATVKTQTFVDVSSHNGTLSEADYRELIKKGVGGVVVKLTEGTHYVNPYAESQIRNAQRVGLQVSAYAFSHYTSDETARAEARFFVEHAKRLNLPSNTVMVNDMEDNKMKDNINNNTQSWTDEMKRLGFSNLMYYTSASWLDVNNLRGKGPVQTSRFGLENFWVAQYPTPTLSTDGAKSLKYNSNAGAWQFTSQAELLSGRHVFDHSVDYTGRFTSHAKPINHATGQPLRGTITVRNNDTMKGSYDLVISNVSAPYGVREVLVPTWSTVNGQDDLIWHTATKQNDGSYVAHIKSSEHKNSTGEYHSHVYYIQNNGEQVGVGGTTTQVAIGKPPVKASGKITIQNKNNLTGTFDVIVSDIVAPNGLKEVLVPSWSATNGQDDLIWHKAIKQSDGTYKATIRASEHKYSTGLYHSHVYYVQSNGSKIGGIAATTTQVTIDYTNIRPAGKISIENINKKEGSFDVIVSDIVAPNGLKEVLVPSWSATNGQDDLIWHKAIKQSDGTYKATIRASEHKYSTGLYHSHVYYVQSNGSKIGGIAATTTQVTIDYTNIRPIGKLSIENINKTDGSFDVVVSDVHAPKGVREVQVPTWSDVNGQDDLVWYAATKQSDGTYRAKVRSQDHKNSLGMYHVHLYYIQQDGTRVGVSSTTTQVEIKKDETKPTVSIKNINEKAGVYTVAVDQATKGKILKQIRVAAWSQANQENLFWYVTAPTGTHTEVTVNAVNHKSVSGNYTTHVYLEYTDGSTEGYNKGTVYLSPSSATVSNQRASVLRAAAELVGVKGGSEAHRRLVEDYNSVKPLPVGYAVKNTDDWCDIFTTVIFQRQGLSHLVGRECGVERHIQIFKKLGIWNEDGNSTPKAGDIITFNWDQDSQQNDGWADHIGIVEKVENGIIHTIEGNSNNQVKRNMYRIGHGNIRGFASPKYGS
ncbi:GBS Bsp-like repeat protein [Streptococcus sp. oral taxon 056 str. F0418]|uniref:GBS Bsp-like repeat-containing protein n=1 Tax=Streptococcus sp. oral taxon 056 TaxID=712620 RepID=UPI0002180599|nr:GBS Bsp-like repeat protein [Streptococcus sp. oral taxon 056 str. F0418]